MTRRWVVVACIAVLLLLVVPVSADWLDGWDARKSHVINNTGDALSDYQIKLIVHRSDGSDSGDDVYIGSSGCESDYDDIRFTKSDGTTFLDYWIEESDSSDATIWVEVDTIAASGNTTIYLYYGNAGASAVSSGDDTFLFFDNVANAIGTEYGTVGGTWTTEDDGGHTVRKRTNGGASVFGSDNTAGACTSDDIDDAFIVHSQVKQTDSGSVSWTGIMFRFVDSTHRYFAAIQNDGYCYLFEGGSIQIGSYYGGYDNNAFHEMMISVNGTAIKVYMDGTLRIDVSDNSFSTGKLGLLCYADGGAEVSNKYYNTFVRKYAATEPTHGAWGSEEKLSCTQTIIGKYNVGEFVSQQIVGKYNVNI
ncbi:MAG: DUF2341 domain-containing protein, partial [Methanoregulaceae archaeon]|nr:DUF2341 domain-containing protein [Methanoregulaceae archaeon]